MRVLQYTYGGSQISGIESYLVDAYKGIDRSKTQFDFLFRYRSPLDGIATELTQMGAEVRTLGVPEQGNVVVKQLRELAGLWKFFRRNRYDVVEINMTAVFMCLQAVMVAAIFGTKVRIVHSHDSVKHEPKLKRILKSAGKPLLRAVTTDFWSCSRDAAEYLFGRRLVEAERWTLVRNAIDVSRFAYSREVREQMRLELGVPDGLVIGMVGRMTEQKNHAFALRIFKELLRERADAQLVIAGDGQMFEATVALAVELEIDQNVKFLGARRDIPGLLCAFDVMFAPSKHEGFPVIALEAQAAGLGIVASDSFPEETNLNGHVQILALDDTVATWVGALSGTPTVDRDSGPELIIRAGHDRAATAAALDGLYANVRGRLGVQS